jgi:hypothetical protein
MRLDRTKEHGKIRGKYGLKKSWPKIWVGLAVDVG